MDWMVLLHPTRTGDFIPGSTETLDPGLENGEVENLASRNASAQRAGGASPSKTRSGVAHLELR